MLWSGQDIFHRQCIVYALQYLIPFIHMHGSLFLNEGDTRQIKFCKSHGIRTVNQSIKGVSLFNLVDSLLYIILYKCRLTNSNLWNHNISVQQIWWDLYSIGQGCSNWQQIQGVGGSGLVHGLSWKHSLQSGCEHGPYCCICYCKCDTGMLPYPGFVQIN